METKKFLDKALGSEGFYCVFAFRTSDDRRVQKFYDSIDALIEAAHNLDAEGYDAYFALATFEEEGSRKVDNVKELNTLFLDLDCGPSKDYASQEEAMKALRGFCQQFSLPNPLLVNSGRGVHVYWFLKQSVKLIEWLPVAERLKKLCADNNLLADPAVTADAARVLRVPYTHNHKTDPPSPVEFFGMGMPDPVDFDAFAELLGDDPIPVPSKYVPEGSSAVMDALMGNKENKFGDILRKTLAGKGCEQIKSLITNPAEVSEPMWRAGLSIAKFCVDSDKAAQVISKGHPDYNEHDTMRKMDLIKGPYLCAKFDEYNPDICKDCSHFGKIKSPIVLGQKVREAGEEDNVVELFPEGKPVEQYIIPAYPRPYFRGANGGVYTRTTNADGEVDEKVIYHNDIYVIRRIRDVELGEAIVMRLHLPRDGVREFTVPLTAVTSREEFRKCMAMEGVAVTKVDELMQYTTTWVNELQANTVAKDSHRQFGWSDDNFTSFILGDKQIFADRIEFNPPAPPTSGLFHAFEPKGTLEGWKETMAFYNAEDLELHQFVIGTSFGSPLMQFSPIHCMGLHIHGGSGVGKTTAMNAGLSVWGLPEDLLTDQKDTHNTRMHRGEVYHSLPLYMDELTNAKSWELSDLVYQLTGGRQRGRMASGSNTERHRGRPWRLLAVTSANSSMWEKISRAKAMPTAEAQRILEFDVKRRKFNTKLETDVLIERIPQNHTHAGIKYIQHVMNDLDGVKALIRKVQTRVDEQAGLTAENRFWSVGVTMTLTGLLIAKRIGLIDYDLKNLFNWSIELLKENKRNVNDMGASVEATLNDYIHEHWSNVLWIKSTDDLRKQNENGLDSLIVPEALPRGKLVARYETDLKRAYLVPKPLKAWCIDQQINYTAFVDNLRNSLGARKAKMRLSKGTHMNLPPTDVIIVDCAIGGDDIESLDGSSED
jgi:hypothetical protein